MITSRILAPFLLFTLFTTIPALCEDVERSESRISLVPHGLLFRPLVANPFEPRVGLSTQIRSNRIMLDIGNSVDLLRLALDGDGSAVTLGTDFFAYTLLRGESNFHFPVDAADFLFGINFNYKGPSSHGPISGRLRISHVSAHFVDGHYDNATARWKDSRYPNVYSREFLDGVVACEPTSLHNAVRAYLGAIYLFHVNPDNVGRLIGNAGVEIHGELLAHTNVYLGYQAAAMKVAEFALRHNIQAGGKIGEWNGRGVNAYLSYFSGYALHGEYYDLKENYFALGFLVDF